MGQAKPFRATALVVEDDPMQREMISLLLEESDFDVIECESAEAAALVLQRQAGGIALVMTDVSLAGTMDGVTLAHVAKALQSDSSRSSSPRAARCRNRCRMAWNSGPSRGRRSTSSAWPSASRARCRPSRRASAQAFVRRAGAASAGHLRHGIARP